MQRKTRGTRTTKHRKPEVQLDKLKPDALLTEEEAAKSLMVEPPTLNKWRQRERGPAYLKIGGRVSYRVADLLAFLAQCRVVPRAWPAKPRRGTRGMRRGSR